MITENLSTLKIHKLTQEQYDRELVAGNIDENALYLTPDEDIDLSPYATKEDLAAIDYPVDSVNGKKGNVSITLSDFDITATATELNYVDGVTSNIQTQLNGKASSSHNHSASNITSGTLSSNRLPTVPIAKGGTGATTAAAALTNLGITATAAELNKLDGCTATVTELNYVDGVTSNIQTQLNTLSTNKFDKSGGTITGTVQHTANHYVHYATNSNATACYMKFATIKVTGSYINQEIQFKISQRDTGLTTLGLRYENVDSTTPNLNTFETDNKDFWIYNEGNGVWSLYGYCTSWDMISILDFLVANNVFVKISVTWKSETASALPSGAVTASSRAISSKCYGTTLPSSAPAGAIFFKKV